MINEENLNNLYKSVLDEVELTTKELKKMGFNSRDLKNLIEKGSVVRVKRGLYDLNSADELFCYGKNLIAQKEYDKATQCFEKCYQIDPTHSGVCFQLFLRCIKRKDYQKAFKYFDTFYNSENEFYRADSNFYLYLLSMITELPTNYREISKNLSFSDFRVDYDDKRYDNVYLYNVIRTSVFNHRFILALRQLNKAIQEKGRVSVQDLLVKTLLNQAIEVQRQNKYNILDLINQKNYGAIIEFYENLLNLHYLSISDDYVLTLTRELLYIVNSKNIPKIQVHSTDSIFDAIDGKNFELALSLVSERDQKYNIDDNDNAIYLLLNDIINICKDLKATAFQMQDVEAVDVLKGEIKLAEKITTNSVSNSSVPASTIFASIIKFLMNNDLDNTFKALKNYLININKSNYEFLIVDLIKISLLENDVAFTKPMIVLTLISQENYSLDVSKYIQEFYINLSQNNFEVARIYLDIISKGNKLSQDCIIVDGLLQVLELSEKMSDYQKNNAILDLVDEKNEESKNSQITISSSKEQIQLVKAKKEEIQKRLDSEKEFIAKKYKELLNNKGIILLKSMDSDRIDRILEIVKEYSDMVAFVISEGSQKRVVLRYIKKVDEHVKVNKIIYLGNKAYRTGNYDKCIENYLQLLQLFDEPRSIIYSKIGLAYFRKFEIPLAIDYLTIATSLSVKENASADFSSLIAKLKGEISKEDYKPGFLKMDLEDFDYNDVNDYYGIENFSEINSYILESGLDVESACEKLGLTSVEIDTVKLIYAREFYAQGNYVRGDLFLKSVEKSKNKTKEILKIFEEIRKNKKFYKNRVDEKHKELVLTLNSIKG